MSRDRHVMTLYVLVCRNTWVTRVIMIAYWKKLHSSFEIYGHHICMSFLMTCSLVI